MRAALETDTQHGAVVPPIHLTSTFAFSGYGEKREYDYSRSGNPTRDALGRALAELEGGVGRAVTASGMGAVSLDHAAAATRASRRRAARLLRRHVSAVQCVARCAAALNVRFVDYQDAGPLAAALAASPRWSGSRRRAIRCCASWTFAPSRRARRQHGALVVVDNTFLSPVWQRPIELGADLVVHSTTKYLNGHSDVVGGAVIAATPELHEQVQWWGNCIGVTGAPFDSFLTLRGLRTLHARMRAHGENAQRIAELLSRHPAVAKVYFPGLPSHPGHALARSTAAGLRCDGQLRAARARRERARRCSTTLHLFSLAESLGGVESLVAHPASMTHAAMDEAARHRAGISDALVRLSIGIEDGDDLAHDLTAGLDAAARA